MPTINLPYGTQNQKQIRVVGENAGNTSERPVTNLSVFVNASLASSVTISPTGDPNVFTILNHNSSSNASGTLSATGMNEINGSISGSTPIQLVAADPATTILISEL